MHQKEGGECWGETCWSGKRFTHLRWWEDERETKGRKENRKKCLEYSVPAGAEIDTAVACSGTLQDDRGELSTGGILARTIFDTKRDGRKREGREKGRGQKG